MKRTELIVLDFPHKDDWYLKLVLCKYGNEYVVWDKNLSIGGYHRGKYFDNMLDAYKRLLQEYEAIGGVIR